MAAEVEQRHIPVFVHEDESSHGLASSSSLPNMDQETSLHADINLGSPSSTLAEKLSSFHLKRDNECDNMSDNDSAKAGLDDSTDDELLTATSTNDPLDSDISAARERQASRLAEIYSRIEQTTRDHDAAVEALFRARIASLTLTIKTGDQERENLTQIIRQKDTEIGNLHQEIAQEKQRHAEELAQQAKLAHEERVRAGMEWEREFNEAMEKRGHEHQESIEQQHQQHHQAIEQREQEHQQALESLRQEMMQESEQRVSNLIEEMQREAEQRVNKIRSEMDQMRAEFERETEQTMKDMRGEMARLVEREREAREKLRRAETMPLNNNRGAQSRDQSPNVRPGLQQSSSWAIARLWGVGQPRTRSFS